MDVRRVMTAVAGVLLAAAVFAAPVTAFAADDGPEDGWCSDGQVPVPGPGPCTR